MADIFDISVSGLRAFQSMLATTSHNIANVNTEGYSRQKVDLTTRTPQYQGFGYIGSGVEISKVSRQVDQFIDRQLVSNSSLLSQLNGYMDLISQLDNLVADPDAGLSPGIQNFFNSVQNVADDPSSLPARELLIGDAQTLIDRFSYFNQRFDDLQSNANSDVKNSVVEINNLAKNIGDLNRQISTALGNANTTPVNDLLDQRQQLVLKLSEHVSVSTVEQDDGSLNVFIGTGQALVVGFDAQTLSTGINQYDATKLDVFASNGTANVNVTNQLTGGAIGAALSFVDEVLTPSRNALGQLALGIADTFNTQHQAGMDLYGNLGGDFFNPVNSAGFGATVNDSVNNSAQGLGNVSASISDVGALTDSDYILRYDGSNNYSLTRLSDNTVTSISAGSYPFTSASIDGFTVSINSAATAGDSWRIRPTANAIRGIDLAITDGRLIAAAVPVIGSADIQNTGTGLIGNTLVSNTGAYVADTYTVFTADNTSAVVDGGATRGTITDTGANSTLQYELRVNGVLVYTQNEAAAPLANLSDLATQINTQVANTGVRAYVNAAGTDMYFVNDPQSTADITVQETLNTTAGVTEDADTVMGYFGSALTGATTPSNTITFSSPADSYIALNSSNTAVADGAYTSGNTISFNGISTQINGTVNLGDRFTVGQNTSGVSDNRNMLLLAGLQDQKTLAGGTASYLDVYGNMVADVGTRTRKTELTRDAQNILYNQSIEAREAKSGVNLDEEAANLVRYQQAYQAVAQVVSTADNLFQTLLSVLGR